MNEHAYFHWDLLRQPLQTPQFGMGAPFFDVNSILELRKEKSRDAARSRRGKENYEFYELAKLLPLPAAITSQLDKASIIRLTISYLKLRDFSSQGEVQWTQDGTQAMNKMSKGHPSRLDIMDPFESRQGTHILQSLDGFAFILANDGRFLYISETVSIYLGLSQVEMAGSSIFDYVHPQDHTELAEHLGMCLVPIGRTASPQGSGSDDASSPATPRPGSPTEKGYMMVYGPDKNVHKSFSLRMKSTLTKRGVHVKTSGYRVVHVVGTLRPQRAFSVPSNNSTNASATGNNTNSGNASSEPPLLGLVGMAIALPPPTVTELRLELDTFITRLSPDFKVIYCEPIIADLMDLSVEDVTDRLLYDLCHVADLKSLRRSHSDILNKGQALTDYYRLINRHGGFVWIQTCATTLLNNKNADDQTILAINYVVSGAESKTCPMDLWQVSGDVSSAMSSTSNSRCREEKLKELKASRLAPSTISGNKTSTGHLSTVKTGTATSSSMFASDRSDVSASDAKSVTDETLAKHPLDPAGEDVDSLSPEKNGGGIDSKNKRRKMENPRKRKRSSSDPSDPDMDKALNLTRSGNTNPTVAVGSQCSQIYDKNASDRHVDNIPTISLPTDVVSSSSPEDLSMKTSLKKSPDRNIIQHSSNVFRGTPPADSDRQKTSGVLDTHISHSSSPVSLTGSSVKELEAAMNRHLPVLSNSTAYTSQNERTSLDSILTDSSGIAKGFSSLANSSISANPPPPSSPWLHSPRSSGPDMLTASNFLRSLYANRESVIKTSARSQAPFLNSDPPTSLLTPPEPDPMTYRDHSNPYAYGKPDNLAHPHIYDKDSMYEARDHVYKDQTHRDQYSFIPYKDHIPSSYIDHLSSSVYKDHIASTYKDLSPYKDIIPTFTIPSLMSPTSRMHQPYPSLHHHFPVPITTATMDACSITPPSSNSPDMNKPPPPSQHFDPASFTTDLTNACNLSQKQAMNSSLVSASSSPIPSQLYHTNRHHKDQLYQGVTNNDLAKSGYYGMTTPPTSSMYMDLNQASVASGQYETCTRPVLPWY